MSSNIGRVIRNIIIATKIIPEPSNKFDSRALSFQCFHKGKWRLIGYIAHELLDEVHKAINQQLITNVQLVTVKYIPYFASPGWYAGIRLTKKGVWSRLVVKKCSRV